MIRRYAICLALTLLIAGCAGGDAAMRKRQANDLRRLGEAYLLDGKYSRALLELQKSLELNPDDHILQDDLGLVYGAKEKYEEAVAHFQRSIELNPEYMPARNNLATVYLVREKWDTAIKILKDLLEHPAYDTYQTPHYPLSNLGWAYYNLRDYVMAEMYYRQALEFSPDFVVALRGMGLTLLDSGKAVDSVSFLRKAAAGTPRSGKAMLDLGRALEAAGRPDEAINAFRRAEALTPDSPVGAQARHHLKRLGAN